MGEFLREKALKINEGLEMNFFLATSDKPLLVQAHIYGHVNPR